MCLDVYFNDNHSEAKFTTVNAGLYSLLWDYSFHVVGQERDEYVAHAHLCRDNLETILSSLPLHLPANSDTILALLFGVNGLFNQSCIPVLTTLNSRPPMPLNSRNLLFRGPYQLKDRNFARR